MMKKEAIVFDRVTKTFPKATKPSVNETSLVIEQGSFVTILGASGSGKTTLLKMVNRIIEPTSGTISLFGKNIREMPATELRRSIGYVIQQVGLFPHMTIEQNIATVPNILGWDRRKISERVDYLMDLVHLPPSYKTRYPRQLSGGQQQRVGIARAMAGDPAVLLMDEPFGAIDAITRTKLQDDFLEIQKKLGKTILFVTHDVDEAFKLGDRIVVMNEGSIQQYDPPLNLVTRPANEFVSRLIQADDLFQRLQLMKAEDHMLAWTEADAAARTENVPRVRGQDSLRTVLQKLLQHDAPYVAVVNGEEKPVGKVTLEQLKTANSG
ncbi:MAG: L-proline glycine betaine ABC transport system permease protein ProV [Candidatus Carbobacillus altaicus]|uniref:Carnitine transport ATP-binding protein OpuCA n=1 Tax=Candidatus Carbonibacillus altaicus TaxID=2163959 RepID=A0A2R6Y2G7_9BACL|nr:MAG: L-proline glycine betaine ABC transport system permease protein ProV [Candidatus Carbobacillus altaicus]